MNLPACARGHGRYGAAMGGGGKSFYCSCFSPYFYSKLLDLAVFPPGKICSFQQLSITVHTVFIFNFFFN